MALKQEGTVKEYQRNFELLAVPLSMVPEAVLEGNFTNGLKAEIRAEIRMHKPKGFGPIMELAQCVEDRNEYIKQAQLGVGPNKMKLNLPSPLLNSSPQSTVYYPQPVGSLTSSILASRTTTHIGSRFLAGAKGVPRSKSSLTVSYKRNGRKVQPRPPL